MAKIRIGHDPRKKSVTALIKESSSDSMKLDTPVEQIKPFDETDLMRRLQEMVDIAKPAPIEAPKAIETVVIKEVSKLDKRARSHSKAVSARSKMTSEHVKTLSVKIEAIEEEHNKLINLCDKMVEKIEILESRKPEEKQIVIERNIATRIEHKVPKHIYIALAISLILNVVILLK